jgi:DNA-binding NtrC family response regulator
LIAFETVGGQRDIAAVTESGTLALPMKRPAAADRSGGQRRGDHATPGFKTMHNIVIYEDDGPMLALLKEWLGEAGYNARGFAQPAGQPWDHIDLVIVSVSMPKHAGIQRVRDVKATHPHAPLIAISSQFRSGLSTAGATAQLLGVDQVMAKPLAREDLLGAVRDIIGPPSRVGSPRVCFE